MHSIVAPPSSFDKLLIGAKPGTSREGSAIVSDYTQWVAIPGPRPVTFAVGVIGTRQAFTGHRMTRYFEIRTLGPDDEQMLANVAAGVFDHTPTPDLTAEFLNDPRHHLVVALDSGRIVGFVSAVDYVHPDKPAELWINEVAVAPAHQNQGVGRLMLRNMLALGRRLGCRCAWVLTNHVNIPAMHLYAASGGVAEADPSVLFEFDLAVAGSEPEAASP